MHTWPNIYKGNELTSVIYAILEFPQYSAHVVQAYMYIIVACVHICMCTHVTRYTCILCTTRCAWTSAPDWLRIYYKNDTYFCDYRTPCGLSWRFDNDFHLMLWFDINNMFCEYHRKRIHKILLSSLCL